MIVINAEGSNGPEKKVQAALRDLPGVLVANIKVANGRTTRETDALVISPTGVFVVEAKGATGNPTGELTPRLNGAWTIGDAEAQFYGSKAPQDQARKAAQHFAGYLRERSTMDQFVTALVSVSAHRVTMSTGPVELGDVVVCLDRDLATAVLAQRKSTVTLDQAMSMLEALDLGNLPARAEVAAQGFPLTGPTRRATKTTRPAPNLRAVTTNAKKTATSGPAATPGSTRPQSTRRNSPFPFSRVLFLAAVIGGFLFWRSTYTDEFELADTFTEYTQQTMNEYTADAVTSTLTEDFARSGPALETECEAVINKRLFWWDELLEWNCLTTIEGDPDNGGFLASYDPKGNNIYRFRSLESERTQTQEAVQDALVTEVEDIMDRWGKDDRYAWRYEDVLSGYVPAKFARSPHDITTTCMPATNEPRPDLVSWDCLATVALSDDNNTSEKYTFAATFGPETRANGWPLESFTQS